MNMNYQYSLGCVIVVFCVVAGYNNGVGERPALGWNTWCSVEGCGTDVCNEVEIKEIAQAMRSNGMYDAGYRWINLDDCWVDCERDQNGKLQPDPDRFPGGMKSLADTLHGYGFYFGLYTSAGDQTCSSGTRDCPDNKKPPGSFGMDILTICTWFVYIEYTSNTDHYEEDTVTFASWSVDYVKLDWCGQDITNATDQHTAFSAAMNATGRPMWLELCRGYGLPTPSYVAKVANSWRITGDHHDDWESVKSAIAQSAGQTKLSGPYNWAYNDFLMTGGQGCDGDDIPDYEHPHCPKMTDTEYITEFSMWSIIASPLIVATDVRNMTDIMKTVLLNEEIIAVNQNYDFVAEDNSKPRAGDIVPALTVDCDSKVENACQVWARKISKKKVAIVLYNAGDEEHEISVVFNELPGGFKNYDKKKGIKLRDLWKHETMGYWIGNYTNTIQAHGVQFLIADQV